MSLEPPEKVRSLRRKLYEKAKRELNYRFYLLYDKVYRQEILEYAWRLCRANGGAPGVDGERYADIESKGVAAWLEGSERSCARRPYFIRANAISSFAWPSTISVPFPGAHLAGLAEVISEQITMFVSPVKQESLRVALPCVNRTLPAQRFANTCKLPPPNELLQYTLGPLTVPIGAA